MATRTITHLYDTYDEAARAVNALEGAGIAHADISIVGHDAETSTASSTATSAGTGTEHAAGNGAGAGATLGTVVGGGAGLLAGIGALAIPGVGPLVAAGWLIATLTGAGAGAAAGGLLGSLTGAGVSETDAHVYAEGVRRGGTLVSVRASEADADRVTEILGATNRVDIGTRADSYRATGWSAYDPAAPQLTAAELEAERVRTRAPLA